MVLPTISDCPPTTHSQTPVFLSFYNLVLPHSLCLSRFLLSALMNTLQSPVMEHRPELRSFPAPARFNHQQLNQTSWAGDETRPSLMITSSRIDITWIQIYSKKIKFTHIHIHIDPSFLVDHIHWLIYLSSFLYLVDHIPFIDFSTQYSIFRSLVVPDEISPDTDWLRGPV